MPMLATNSTTADEYRRRTPELPIAAAIGETDATTASAVPASSADSGTSAVSAGESYFGGKGGAGVFQTLINLMPPHRVYIEAFLGSGRIMRMKLPADRNIGIDLDGAAISSARPWIPSAELKMVDAISWLEKFRWQGGELVYCDPPYLLETRASGQARYRFELTHHERLLRVIKALPCYVMISGYWSELYAQELANWRVVKFQAKTRGGMATECVWLNFPEPLELHDYRFLGSNFRQRQNIKKKKKRWANKLMRMPALERYAVLAAIRDSLDQNASGQTTSTIGSYNATRA